MSMVRVVDMAVSMLQGRMLMLVFMHLSEMQPDACCHQHTSGDELSRNRFV